MVSTAHSWNDESGGGVFVPGATRKALNIGGFKNFEGAADAVEAMTGVEYSDSKSEVSGST